jgi:hypothetical protein
MIEAKLIKDLEKKGFELDFPSYGTVEEEIVSILKKKNDRLNLAIPLLLQEEFDYNKIKKSLAKDVITLFNRIILIARDIFQKEGIDNSHIKKIIKEQKISLRVKNEEISRYLLEFRDAKRREEKKKEIILAKRIESKQKLDMNKALSILFSPGKTRIMQKIFNHEKLSNTELKYYYRAIRPQIIAIKNNEMRDYINAVFSTKKYS